MKPGLNIGDAYEYNITVADAMRAQFGAVVVHNLYATASMLSHMEWASRQHILPYLEDGEEGVGYHADIRHLAPTPVGATVNIKSTVTHVDGKFVTTKTEAWNDRGKIGEAVLVQALVRVDNLYNRATEAIPGQLAQNAHRPAMLWSEDCRSSFALSIKGFEHNFPCTRYDEWFICLGELNDHKITYKHEGPFLLKYETEELIDGLRRVYSGEQASFQSDFMQQILSINAAREQDRCRLEIGFRQPDEAKHKDDFETLKASLLCTRESLQEFCRTLGDQLNRFDSNL